MKYFIASSIVFARAPIKWKDKTERRWIIRFVCFRFAIVACDGLWKSFSNLEAVTFAAEQLEAVKKVTLELWGNVAHWNSFRDVENASNEVRINSLSFELSVERESSNWKLVENPWKQVVEICTHPLIWLFRNIITSSEIECKRCLW